MPRTGHNAGPLVVPAPSRKRRARFEPDDIGVGKARAVARGDGDGDRGALNRLHVCEDFYGFLASADGPPKDGPWLLSFEGVEAEWLRQNLPNIPNHGLDAMRLQLQGGNFDTVWAAGIGHRVAISRIAARYQSMAFEQQAPLIMFDCELTSDELNERFRAGPEPFVEGWYWFSIAELHADPEEAFWGELYREDPATGMYREPEAVELRELERAPPVYRAADDDRITESLLHALHYAYE